LFVSSRKSTTESIALRSQIRDGVEWCTYCGRLADTIDHVVPRHLLKRAAEIGYSPAGFARLIVPACRECNSYLGGRIHGSLEQRRAEAKEGIRKRYARALRVPDWTEEELAEMSPKLRREIKVTLMVKQETKIRLSWTNPREQDRDIRSVLVMFREAAEAATVEDGSNDRE
jgi:hypothetical protein